MQGQQLKEVTVQPCTNDGKGGACSRMEPGSSLHCVLPEPQAFITACLESLRDVEPLQSLGLVGYIGIFCSLSLTLCVLGVEGPGRKGP